MVQPTDFIDEPTRRQWIIENAVYFTVIRRHKMQYERREYTSLRGARVGAKRSAQMNPGARYMIYAVTAEGRDTFVETIG